LSKKVEILSVYTQKEYIIIPFQTGIQ